MTVLAPSSPQERVSVLRAVDVSDCDIGSDGAHWDAYVRSARGASAYHAYAWRELVQRIFNHETVYLAARDSTAAIVGVLPLVRLRSRLFGDFLVSMPYFNYGGAVAQSPEIARLLIDRSAERARVLGVDHVELRHATNVCPEWPQRTDKVAMLLKLPDSGEALHAQLPSKVRAQIKRPVREGAECASGAKELLDEFYVVFARNMRDLGTPVYPKRFFAAILETFPSQSRVFVVRLAKAPVAAGLVIGHGDALEIPWASSLREANALSVNMLLYWKALEYACEQGYSKFDFGRCTPDSGTYRFKKQWGAQPVQLYWHYWMRDGGEPPLLNHSNPKYRLAVAAWQRLPLPIANFLGPHLVRNLP